jgi:hypothetical protein
VQDYTENVRKNKPKTTKPQSEKSKLTPSNIVKPKQKRQKLISYFLALIIYSINLLKTARKTFAIGNAIYPLSMTIIQITNDNSIFRKEGYLLKSRSDDNEKMSCYRQLNRGLNFYEEIYIHDIPFF